MKIDPPYAPLTDIERPIMVRLAKIAAERPVDVDDLREVADDAGAELTTVRKLMARLADECGWYVNETNRKRVYTKYLNELRAIEVE